MKKTRLLEIIHEEITLALREGEAEEKTAKAAALKAVDLEIKALQKKKADMMRTGVAETQINEDILTEGPFIEGPLDFAYINGKTEKGILGKAITDATQEIKKSFPEIDPDAATKIITSKKSRTAEKTPENVKSALNKIDDAIEAQVDTFVNDKLLKDLLNKGEIGGSPEEIKRINQYIEPDPETGERKEYVEKLGFPQTLRAVEKTLQGKPPTDVEPKTVTKKPEPTAEKPAKKSEEPKAKKSEEPKAKKSEEPKATKTEPKAKESEEDKATKRAKAGGSKLDKIANDQEALQKALKAAEKERLAIAEKRRNTEDVKEREKLLDDLKRVNKLEGELQKKLDQLGF
jgi:hypothetical protein